MATKRNIKKAKIQRYYRTVIIAFAIVAFVLFALIAYFSFSNTIINVSINEENYSTSSLILISRELPIEQSVNNLVAGVLLEKSIEHTKEFTELTAESEVPDKAKGKVIIYNKYSQPQPLIATTRLLSESGILFRTDTRVDVPVGGQVEVSITADQPGEIGEIGPSRFTIPGLWTGLQDKIYAESTEPMTGGTIITTAATQENIDQAKDATFQEAYNIVMDELEKELKTINTDYKINAYKKSLLSEEASVAPDTQADSFSVTTSLNVVSLSFNEDEVQSLAMEHIKDNLPENMKFTLDTDKPFTYTID
ncbi:hypothetical protein KKG41_00880, partial [Patescibacteria group bacterium]|nr:hypothetical protein [Patescibacteria group bacterium]MBU1891027.1 hypothetical protein [Patescibacteria group bacterium]